MRLIFLLLLISFNALATDAQTLLNAAYSRPVKVIVGNTTIERNVPVSAVMQSAPPADAKRLTVYGQEIAIYQNQIFDDLIGWRTVVKSGNDWLYVDEPSYAPSTIKNKADADAAIAVLLAEINASIYETLRPDDPGDPVPEDGKELMQYIMNTLCVVDNEIKVCS